MRRLIDYLFVFVVASIASASSFACGEGDYRAWDFWVGDWQVTSPDGALQGTNSITREENGCLLVERWRGAGGSTGQSYNFFDPGAQRWRQVWVSSSAIIDYSGGLTDEGAMRLEGQITYQSSGQEIPFYGQWSKQTDGSVLQELFQWNTERDDWDSWFVGIYRRSTPKTE